MLLKTGWTYTSDSLGYMLFLDGKPQGGARSMGTYTTTYDGRRRSWQARRADAKMHAETAARICAERNWAAP